MGAASAPYEKSETALTAGPGTAVNAPPAPIENPLTVPLGAVKFAVYTNWFVGVTTTPNGFGSVALVPPAVSVPSAFTVSAWTLLLCPT